MGTIQWLAVIKLFHLFVLYSPDLHSRHFFFVVKFLSMIILCYHKTHCPRPVGKVVAGRLPTEAKSGFGLDLRNGIVVSALISTFVQFYVVSMNEKEQLKKNCQILPSRTRYRKQTLENRFSIDLVKASRNLLYFSNKLLWELKKI